MQKLQRVKDFWGDVLRPFLWQIHLDLRDLHSVNTSSSGAYRHLTYLGVSTLCFQKWVQKINGISRSSYYMMFNVAYKLGPRLGHDIRKSIKSSLSYYNFCILLSNIILEFNAKIVWFKVILFYHHHHCHESNLRIQVSAPIKNTAIVCEWSFLSKNSIFGNERPKLNFNLRFWKGSCHHKPIKRWHVLLFYKNYLN